MKSKLLCAAALVTLAAPTALLAQSYGYGWNITCEGAFGNCAGVEIWTAPIDGGATQITAWGEATAATDWTLGAGQWLVFSETAAFDAALENGSLQGVGSPFEGHWTYVGVLPFMGWSSFVLPFTVQQTDLVGAGANFYTFGAPPYQAQNYNEDNVDLTNPQYITPEPATLVLLSTGLLGIGAVICLRRRTA